jgi:RNA-directed DNA polymerase
MLTALEQGVKGGKWFALSDKLWNENNLFAASVKVVSNAGGAGIDGQSVETHRRERSQQLETLARELREGTYRPHPSKRVWIPKPGRPEKRPLGIPTVRDRVVQTALRNVMEPIFEREFAEHSYGFRPQRGCRDALRRVKELLDRGYTHVVDGDIQGYFDTIDHEVLMRRMGERIADGRIKQLIEGYLKAGVLDTHKGWEPTERGTPQGAVISPLLANIYLNPLDHLMAAEGYEMVRYADDLVVLCRSREEAGRAMSKLAEWMRANGLKLHPEKTRVVDASQRGGFDFLGYHFERGYCWPRQKSLDKIKDAIRQQTRRANGKSMEMIVCVINAKLRGWYGYFKHSHKTTFREMDGWVRMRLRSILRKRSGRRGRGRGTDHQRWPNAYFGALGLFNLEAARAKACQSR